MLVKHLRLLILPLLVCAILAACSSGSDEDQAEGRTPEQVGEDAANLIKSQLNKAQQAAQLQEEHGEQITEAVERQE